MKYGEQLASESVPEWSFRRLIPRIPESRIADLQKTPALILVNFPAPDNIDYNSLKHHIKVHTTKDQATAIAIPGHQDAALRKFEDELYTELCRQHDRVGLFVTSKYDEIKRRLRTYHLGECSSCN